MQKIQVQSFLQDRLKIDKTITLVYAYRIGKPEVNKKRAIKFKLLDPNDVSLIFSQMPNLKGIKNEDNDKYLLTEYLSERNREQQQHYRDLKTENRNLPVAYQSEIKMKANTIQVDGTTLEEIATPPIGATICLTDQEIAKIKPIDIWEGQEQVVESSKFIGYVIESSSFQTIKDAYSYLRNQHLGAAHIMCGYRLFGKNVPKLQNYSDDNEYGGGRAVLAVLKEMGVFNIAVFVVRYRDHLNIGAKRFEAIRNATKSALAAMTVIPNRGDPADQVLTKALNDAVPKPKADKHLPSGRGGCDRAIRGGRGR